MNVILHVCYALIYSLLSAAELRDGVGNYQRQEKYLLYSAVENNSRAKKKTKAMCPYELFDIKTKTKTEITFTFTLLH